MPDEVKLTIDGRQISVPKGTLVVEAAKQVGIEIPVFCYHHKLDPVGACRMCVVEITPGPPKPTTACTTPVAEGMVIQTESAMAAAARADILEFELVNHPLDCPVCDKGGECPLQDYTFRHGYPVSRIDAPRVHFRKPIPLSEKIALDRERCVLCYRCTRYYDEIAWEQELTVDQRGVNSYITNQGNQPLRSVFSGNIIDLCPVGALTSKLWRFESRPWDMEHQPSICTKCSVGCNVNLWRRRGQLIRVTSRENNAVDDGWICDRGRFDYTDVNSPERIRVPHLDGQPTTWDTALQRLAEMASGVRLGISLRQDVTNEELYLISQLLAGPWQGARVALERRTSLPAPSGPTLSITALEQARTIVVVASDTADDVPIINLRIKKAVAKLGARLILIHPEQLDLDRAPASQLDHRQIQFGEAARALRELAQANVLGEGPVAILYGDGGGREDGATIHQAAVEIAQQVGADLMPLYRATNERGALALQLAGHHSTLEGCEVVLCFGPPAGGRLPTSARSVAVWDYLLRPEHGTPELILPAATFAETAGSSTNLAGMVQQRTPILPLEPPLRESWDVLCELAQRSGAEGFAYAGILEVQRTAANATPLWSGLATNAVTEPRPAPVLSGAARP
ncbi:MAG: 2Fe-2S iron-sulfur cluster-binding protein [Candidatus Dormibacteraceae bacterium]